LIRIRREQNNKYRTGCHTLKQTLKRHPFYSASSDFSLHSPFRKPVHRLFLAIEKCHHGLDRNRLRNEIHRCGVMGEGEQANEN
jgi:hypothetical protein